jgi:hypothetical protein
MREENVTEGIASYWRQKYWAEWGRPPEGPGPHDDRGGPAYIPWLEAKLDESYKCQWCKVDEGMYHDDDCRYWDREKLTQLKTKNISLWLGLIGWLIFIGAIVATLILT